MSENKPCRRLQPKWSPPNDSAHKFNVLNSLTRSKVPFIPIDNTDNHVSWYNCGPTVYDHSHMGHARSYICIDILRRIISDYFGYNVTFVQGLTDIDDKIILRARQNYLFDKFVKNTPEDWEDILGKSLAILQGKFDAEEDKDKKVMYKNQLKTCTEAQSLPKTRTHQQHQRCTRPISRQNSRTYRHRQLHLLGIAPILRSRLLERHGQFTRPSSNYTNQSFRMCT